MPPFVYNEKQNQVMSMELLNTEQVEEGLRRFAQYF